MTDLNPRHYPKQYQQLIRRTKSHELHILHESGPYRHLRFKAPGTALWHWDLITWPGSLAIRGDIGEGFIFTRAQDMLTFFDHGQPDGHINDSYWAEKLDRGSRSVKVFSGSRFAEDLKSQVDSIVKSYIDDPDDEREFREAVAEEVMDPLMDCEDENYATQLLYDFQWNSHRLDEDFDPDDWRDYEYHFILALHAILWGAKKYHAQALKSGDSDA